MHESRNRKSFPIVLLGGGAAAGYAANLFVAQSGKRGDLAIGTAKSQVLTNTESPRA